MVEHIFVYVYVCMCFQLLLRAIYIIGKMPTAFYNNNNNNKTKQHKHK